MDWYPRVMFILSLAFACVCYFDPGLKLAFGLAAFSTGLWAEAVLEDLGL